MRNNARYAASLIWFLLFYNLYCILPSLRRSTSHFILLQQLNRMSFLHVLQKKQRTRKDVKDLTLKLLR